VKSSLNPTCVDTNQAPATTFKVLSQTFHYSGSK
jgi:hypothetical protein